MPGARRKPPVGTVTFLFTDIEGSTELVRRSGAAWPRALEAHRAILRSAASRHGGVARDPEGDSFFAAFVDAPAAVAAAAEIQRGLAARSWPRGASVRVRIGIHTGEGRLSRGDYVGLDIHRAARIGAAGHGGQVLLSDATRALVEHVLPARISLRDLGEHMLKDFPQPARIYQLVFEDLQSVFPPLRTVRGPGGNLPEPLTTFVGRERELDKVRELVGRSRLLTLVGPGGIGKTRLVVELAKRVEHDYRDGAWFVDLAAIGDPGQVPAAIASAIGLREVGEKRPEAVLRDHLRLRQSLLILDNFEHLVEATPIVSTLLSAASDLRVVVTSQVQLRLSGEQVYPVPSLSVPMTVRQASESDAVRLFIDRATRARPDFAIDSASEASIAEICRRLDGLPLAIELAAARVSLLSVDDILSRLDSRLQLLSGGPSDAPDRLRTLRGAIAWSFELLSPSAAVLLPRLAVFSRGAPLDAIEATCGDDAVPDVLSALDELVGHSIVVREATGPGTRFRMLESIHEFGLERLRDSDEEQATRARHARWFLDRLEALVPAWRLDPVAGRVLEPEVENIRAALGWAEDAGEAELGLRICGAAWRLWIEVGLLREAFERTRSLLELAGSRADVLDRMRALEGAGGLAYYLGDAPTTLAAYRERLELAEQYGSPAEVADALFDLTFGLARVEDHAGAFSALTRAKAAYADLGDPIGVARCGFVQASFAIFEQRVADARDILEEVIPVLREHGDAIYLGQALGSLAMCELLSGDIGAADRLFTETVRIGLGRANLVGVVIGTGSWARMRKLSGHSEQAALLAGAFEGLSATYGVSMPTQLAHILDAVEARLDVHDALDPAARDRLFDEGRRMTIEQLLEYARATMQVPIRD